MKWVIVHNIGENIIYGRFDDDGVMRVTCNDEHPELQEWLAEGNEPEIIDLSNDII